MASASLHYTQGLHFVPPPSVTFRSLSAPSLGYPRKSASIHSIPLMPTLRFIPLPFGFPVPRSGTQSQNEKLHSTHPNSLHCIQSPPLLFPMPTSGMPCEVSAPENQKPQKPHRPLVVQVKIKRHSRNTMCLQPVRFAHSTFAVTLVPRDTTHLFISLTSPASAPHVCVFRTSHPHFPQARQQHFHLFLPANCLPHKTGSQSLSLCSACIERFIMLLK